jgi:hypothetical protein
MTEGIESNRKKVDRRGERKTEQVEKEEHKLKRVLTLHLSP